MSTGVATTRRARTGIQVGGFLRREIVAVLRQPRLLLVLVAGPFVILLLFGLGYDQRQAVLRTAFVGPLDSVYERSIDQYADDLGEYITNEGYSDDLVAAEQRLSTGDVDVVVVFPADPVGTVLDGEQAQITVLHDKIDPIAQVAVEVSSQVAVMELNARVLEEVIGRAQDTIVPLDDALVLAGQQVDVLESADPADAAAAITTLQRSGDAIETVTRSSAELAGALGGDQATVDALSELRTVGNRFSRTVEGLDGSISPGEIEDLRAQLTDVSQIAETTATIDPSVVTRPFASNTASLQREPVAVIDFFAPAAVALLLSHMALTFAAMSLVTERTLGMFEVYRVGPVNAGRVMAGKYLAFLVVGGTVGSALVALSAVALDVPVRGSVAWLGVGLAGLLAASIGLGMVLSLVARSDVQAVQFSMLALLAGLFFGGFFLDLDAFQYPVKALSWLLPVTYGIRLLRDVMLRGVDPAPVDLVGLVVTTLAFGALAGRLLHRQLRTR